MLVDAAGKIVKISICEDEESLDDAEDIILNLSSEGRDLEIVRSGDGFFFPGFVGMMPSSPGS